MEAAELRLTRMRRQRGIILKLVREGHENQLSRLDDFEVWTILLKMSQTVGREQTLTLLQDLCVLGYVEFKQSMNEINGQIELSQIQLTALGLRFVSAGRSNDDVLFA